MSPHQPAEKGPEIPRVPTSSHGRRRCGRALLLDPSARPDEILQAFEWTDLDLAMRDQLIRHPALSQADVLGALALWQGGLRARALSAIQDDGVLTQLAASTSVEVRASVAMNPTCPAELALRLSWDPSPQVRLNAACAPSLPAERRRELRDSDPDPTVRDGVAWLMSSADGQYAIGGGRDAVEQPRPIEHPEEATRAASFGLNSLLRPPV
ncbi:MAG: hypothetical protein QG597_196 [Actinomycetota bacterium]|nr:hypothetical protein [Actinomycetota bacterium]